MNKKEFLNLINQHRKDERHHAQVEKFRNELSSKPIKLDFIPYTDLKFDTLYLASELRRTPRIYYIYVPLEEKGVQEVANRPSNSYEKIGVYWLRIDTDEADYLQTPHHQIGLSSYPRTGTSWMGRLEEIKDFTTQFLNWKGEPWGNEK